MDLQLQDVQDLDIVLKINPELDANLEKYTEVGLRHKSYQQRIFIYFFLTFSFFTILILGFQFNREKNYRISQLESTLDNSIGFVNRFIEVNNLGKGSDFSGLENISLLFPDTNTRVTLIDDKGNVLYDNFVEDYENMENHLMRPEVQKHCILSLEGISGILKPQARIFIILPGTMKIILSGLQLFMI